MSILSLVNLRCRLARLFVEHLFCEMSDLLLQLLPRRADARLVELHVQSGNLPHYVADGCLAHGTNQAWKKDRCQV